MLEPVADLFAGGIVAHDVGVPEFGEMDADGGDVAADGLSELARRDWTSGVEQNNHLIDDRIAEQPAQARLPITLLVHDRRSKTSWPDPVKRIILTF